MTTTAPLPAASVLDDDSLVRFAAAYPLVPVKLRHKLGGHSLLTPDALAKAALRMNPAHVECRTGARAVDGAFTPAPPGSQGIDEIIRSIETSSSWVMLRFINQLPEYRALMAETLATLKPQIEAATGPIRDPLAFVFISSAQSVTPFHFDPEYNILFHVRGGKSFTAFPAAEPFLSEASHDRLHRAGDNLLIWEDAFAGKGAVYDLSPGDALFVPYKAPHSVKVAGEPSISISLTWKSDWSLARDEGHRFNALARRCGFSPGSLPEWPQSVPAKALFSKIATRLGIGI